MEDDGNIGVAKICKREINLICIYSHGIRKYDDGRLPPSVSQVNMNWTGSLMTLNSSRGCHGGGKSGNSDEDRTSDRESLVKRWSNRSETKQTVYSEVG